MPPHLLMLSGGGPKAEREAAGVQCRVDNPHVNLILVTAAAPLESRDEFWGGLVGSRSDFSKSGGGPKEDLFLGVFEPLDEGGDGGDLPAFLGGWFLADGRTGAPGANRSLKTTEESWINPVLFRN